MMRTPPILSRAYIARTRRLFHCHCKVKVPAHFPESLLDDCFDLLERIDARYNSHQPGSYFHRINQDAGRWVEVDDDCLRMLEVLGRISRLTEGAFDITCMPLIRLWGFYRGDTVHRVPSPAEIARTLEHVDYRKIDIEGNRARIAAGQEIITGSFLKAFAVEQVMKLLVAEGVTDAVINAGGSTIAALNDAGHPTWKVNLPDPETPGGFTHRIGIANQAFSLSGRTNNRLVIGNQSYGHILDPRTGFPSSTLQLGVVTPDAFTGDALSTALFTVPADELNETAAALRRHFNFEYFRIEANGNRTNSPCFSSLR